MLWEKLDCEIRKHPKIYFWWREDDVGDYVPELETIMDILGKHPMVLAVPPTFLIPEVEQIIKASNLPVIQHGVEHINHSKNNQQDEFPESIDYLTAAKKILAGKALLQRTFDKQFLPIYAPPWLVTYKKLSDYLLQNGFLQISTYNPDRENNVWNPDIDLINWEYGLSFYTEEYVLERLLYKLSFTNHIGFMCHHRTIGERGFLFIEKLLKFLDQYENIVWHIPPITQKEEHGSK